MGTVYWQHAYVISFLYSDKSLQRQLLPPAG